MEGRLVQRPSPNASQTTTATGNVYILKLKEDKTDESKEEKKPSLSWSEEVINNERLNRKKSNRCCIYRKQRKL